MSFTEPSNRLPSLKLRGLQETLGQEWLSSKEDARPGNLGFLAIL